MRLIAFCAALLLAPVVPAAIGGGAAEAQAVERYTLLSNAPSADGGLRRVVAQFVGQGGRWTEYQDGRARFTFREAFRDNGTIYIHDDSRGVWVRLIPVGAENCRGDYGLAPFPNLPSVWTPLQYSS